MYRNIEISSRGALSATKLENLGQIIVVCGKNNSGKTTLLYSIKEGQQFLYPKQINASAFNNAIRNSNGQSYENLSKWVQNVISIKDRWYEQDGHFFLDQVAGEWRGMRWMGNDIPELYHQEITEEYAKQVPAQSLVYIPPKRVLELVDTIQTNSTVSPNGKGLLNFLFHAKNQFEGSDARKVLDEISRLFRIVSGGFDFFIATSGINALRLSFRYKDSQWVDAEQCGLGLQDLLVLLYFIVAPENDILLIEEPESHLHPEMQRKLLNICKQKPQKQFFFSTHSSVFLDLTLVDTILHTEMKDGIIQLSDDTHRAAILDSLGYSVTDNLVSDLIILTEGPTDKPILEEFMRQMGLYVSFSIKIWPLGGDIMSQLDLTVFAEKYRIMGLIDSDPGSKKVREDFKKNCAVLGIYCHQLERVAIENYFTIDALKKVYRGQFPDAVTELGYDKTLEAQIGFNVKKKNHTIAAAMDVEQDLRGTDLYGFFEMVGQELRAN